jgi:hypothetical protein
MLAAAMLATGATTAAVAQESLPIDRWLVSSPFSTDTAGDPLEKDYLGAPGEVGVLPDRGRTVAGADWSLVRRDSVPELDLEGQRGDDDGSVAVYAHTYVKSTTDRTITLTWGGTGCTRVAAWLNGRSLTGLGKPLADAGRAEASASNRARVRIGHGYNTFLVKAISGSCPFGVTATLDPDASESLEGVRVQASRPYGSTRTGPSPWLLVDDEAGPEEILGWQEDQLFGAAGVRVTAFAVTPIQGAKLKAKTGGEEVRRDIEWLTPAEPATILMPIRFENLRQAAARGDGVQVELDWKTGKWKGAVRLDPEALLGAFHSSIRLLGWHAATGASQTELPSGEAGLYGSGEEPHPLANLIPLPAVAGATLLGEWEIPDWLSGFTLRLDADGAPGDYRVNSVPVQAGEILLCTDCRKGDRIQVAVTSGGAWRRFPGVSVVGVAPPEVDDVRQAVEWLDLLDEKGSRKYRERAGSTNR